MSVIWIKDLNIFDSRAQVLVNPVNCDGVMGAGLALLFKKKFPEMFKDYRARCFRGEINIGSVYLWRNPIVSPKRKSVLLFPTKKHWRDPSHLIYIRQGLESFAQAYNLNMFAGLRSIAFPMLGCGLGGLNRDDVRALMSEHLAPLENLTVEVYLR